MYRLYVGALQYTEEKYIYYGGGGRLLVFARKMPKGAFMRFKGNLLPDEHDWLVRTKNEIILADLQSRPGIIAQTESFLNRLEKELENEHGRHEAELQRDTDKVQ